MHQKARHFKCEKCNKKMATAHALMNHMYTVHKETLTKVKNAKPGRDGVELAIYGMDGVPKEMIAERAKRKKESSSEEEESSSEEEEESPPPPPPPQQAPPTTTTAPTPTPTHPTHPYPTHNTQFPPQYPGMQIPGMRPPMPGMPPSMPGYAPFGQPGMPMPPFPGMGRGVPPSGPPQPGGLSGPPVNMGRGVVMPNAGPPPPPTTAAPAPYQRIHHVETEKGKSTKVIFVYKAELSMEETRARLQKYQFVEGNSTENGLQQVNESIQARLQQLQQQQ